MQFALGVLHWPPATFWSATLPELIAAVEGHNTANGVDQSEPMTDDEVTELLDFANSEIARRNGN